MKVTNVVRAKKPAPATESGSLWVDPAEHNAAYSLYMLVRIGGYVWAAVRLSDGAPWASAGANPEPEYAVAGLKRFSGEFTASQE